MVLGSFLGMVGKQLSNREMINEGKNECKIAAALCEGWDTPLVEPGIILMNTGYYDEALVGNQRNGTLFKPNTFV